MTTNTAMLALDMANSQIEQGWVEVDEDKYEAVQARLELVKMMVKDAERVLAKMEK